LHNHFSFTKKQSQKVEAFSVLRLMTKFW